MGQLALLVQRRFWPLFSTQFFGAFNDNIFKNALFITVAYRCLSVAGLSSERLIAVAAGIFILPFFVFSATAGQLADRVPKSTLMRWVKGAEVLIMAAAAVGFAIDSLPLLLLVLCLMGSQSAFFGPAKYSILPELLDERSLVGGNALVSTGTFLAVLLGTIVGGVFAGKAGLMGWLGWVVLVVALLGLASSLCIPRTAAASPTLRIDPNPLAPTLRILRIGAGNRTVFLSILGISWFWFLGASFLSLLPSFSKDVMGGRESVVTLFLSLFCVGIAAGSLLCERLSRRRLELGLVPLGSLGISVFALDLFLASAPSSSGEALVSAWAFLHQGAGLRVCCDLLAVAVFSGFYTVPLYTLIQQRAELGERSRVIAANNILNALFMVGSSLVLLALFSLGASIPQAFLVLALLNVAVAVYIYSVIPEFLLRFVAWMAANVVYRFRVTGEESLPTAGPALIVANHVSFVDWLLMASAVARPVRFVMDHSFLRMPLVGFLFRDAKVIPIASARDDREVLERAFDRIAEELADGQVVCLFPEGRITPDGEVHPFRWGVEAIVKRSPVQVIPAAIVGMWGSFFSRFGGRAMRRPFRRFWSRVSVRFGEAITPDYATAHELAERVAALGGWAPPPLPQGPLEGPGLTAARPTQGSGSRGPVSDTTVE